MAQPDAIAETAAAAKRPWVPARPDVWLPPERLVRPLLVALPVVAGLAAAAYVTIDLPVAGWVHDAPRPLRRAASAVTELGNSVPILVAAGAGLVAASIARRWSMTSNALLLLWALALTGAVNTLLKFLLGRGRPSLHVVREAGVDVWTGSVPFGFFFFETGYKFMGFPSGHSATAGAVAAVALMLRPRWWPLWAAYALAIPATRVLTNAHYVADVIAGVWVGAACATASSLASLRFIRWREAVAARAAGRLPQDHGR